MAMSLPSVGAYHQRLLSKLRPWLSSMILSASMKTYGRYDSSESRLKNNEIQFLRSTPASMLFLPAVSHGSERRGPMPCRARLGGLLPDDAWAAAGVC